MWATSKSNPFNPLKITISRKTGLAKIIVCEHEIRVSLKSSQLDHFLHWQTAVLQSEGGSEAFASRAGSLSFATP